MTDADFAPGQELQLKKIGLICRLARSPSGVCNRSKPCGGRSVNTHIADFRNYINLVYKRHFAVHCCTMLLTSFVLKFSGDNIKTGVFPNGNDKLTVKVLPTISPSAAKVKHNIVGKFDDDTSGDYVVHSAVVLEDENRQTHREKKGHREIFYRCPEQRTTTNNKLQTTIVKIMTEQLELIKFKTVGQVPMKPSLDQTGAQIFLPCFDEWSALNINWRVKMKR